MRAASNSPSKKTVRIDGRHLTKGPARIINDVVKHLQPRYFMSNPADSYPSSVLSVAPSQLRNSVTIPTGHIDQPQPPAHQDHYNTVSITLPKADMELHAFAGVP